LVAASRPSGDRAPAVTIVGSDEDMRAFWDVMVVRRVSSQAQEIAVKIILTP
jgi:hypothetical protein